MRGICLLLAAIVMIAATVFASVAVAGPFARNCNCPSPCVCTPCDGANCPANCAVASPAAAAPERADLLPWNCPNGKCPREEVSVTVNVPDRPADAPAPAVVSVPAEQAETPFPWPVLLIALVPVVLVASVIAFVVRMHAGSSS